MEKGFAIGIDLGTTYSCVAVYQHGKVRIIPNEQGNRTTPSYVAFTETERIVGDAAKEQVAMNPENTIFDAKRLVGRRYGDSCVQSDMEHWPFKVVNSSGRPKIQVNFRGELRCFYPEEISSMVLTKMRESAEAYLGEPVQEAVITVPAHFNDSQRNATMEAARIAGLEVLKIINEPTAAALAYGVKKKDETTGVKNVLIYDLGGGTFDVSILSIDSGSFMVKATAGDGHLGGEDFDTLMVNHFVQEFRRKHQKDITGNARALRRLRSRCEQAKRTLSSTTNVAIEIDSLFEGADLNAAITRARFEELCHDLFHSTLGVVENALKDAKMSKSDIHDVVLVGGSTRIPYIQKLIQDFFDGKSLNKSANADEAVAYGAAVQAAMLKGVDPEVKLPRLFDVTPLTLGVETAGGAMAPVIKRNTRIPCRKTVFSTTTVDNQKTILIRVFQGERAMAKDNHRLGAFELTGIAPAPKGLPQIEITYEIDDDGILKVSAVDTYNGLQNQITITQGEERFSEEEIDRMIKEAEIYREEDARMKRKIAAKNSLENFCFAVQRKMGTNYDAVKHKVSESERDSVLRRVNEMLEWLDGIQQLANAEVYEDKRSELETHVNPIMSKLEVRA